MQNYTLRNVPQDLWDAITGTMQETGASRRETVLDLIRRGLRAREATSRGGQARQQAMSEEERREHARQAVRARWDRRHGRGTGPLRDGAQRADNQR